MIFVYLACIAEARGSFAEAFAEATWNHVAQPPTWLFIAFCCFSLKYGSKRKLHGSNRKRSRKRFGGRSGRAGHVRSSMQSLLRFATEMHGSITEVSRKRHGSTTTLSVSGLILWKSVAKESPAAAAAAAARHGKTCHDRGLHDRARHAMTWHDTARQSTTGHGRTWHDTARHSKQRKSIRKKKRNFWQSQEKQKEIVGNHNKKMQDEIRKV